MGKGLILGLDTCTKWLNLAVLGEDGDVRAQVQEEVLTHTTRLVPALDALLRKSGFRREELAAVGAVLGPGSFTGLRVGLAAAEGLSKALGVPAFGVDSLTALAEAGAGEGLGWALLDARRRQVYARLFQKGPQGTRPMGGLLAVSPDDVLALSSEPAWAVGDGAPLVGTWPSACRVQPAIPNLAIPAARAARIALAAGRVPVFLLPLYVRAPDAQKPKPRALTRP